MNKEIYIEIEENLKEQLGREPTYEEITDAYASLCDSSYEQMREY